jgi:HlyD family secretion protein
MKPRIGLVFVALLAAACSMDEAVIPLVGTLERDRIELVAEANERIIEVLVAEGDEVQVGQLLMRLDNTLRQTEVDAAVAVHQRAAQRLAELVRGPRREQIRETRARLKGARDHLAIQENEFKRLAELLERGLTSTSEVDRVRDNRENAGAQVAQYAAQLDALLAGTTAEELGQAEAVLAEAEAHLESARLRLMRLEIRAPRNGRIDALPYKQGERPPAQATVIVMLADGAPYARIYVPETLRARVQPGTPANITVDGVAGVFRGSVRYVSADATFTPYFALTQRDRSRLAFLAEVLFLDASAQQLPSGVPVQVEFPAL